MDILPYGTDCGFTTTFSSSLLASSGMLTLVLVCGSQNTCVNSPKAAATSDSSSRSRDAVSGPENPPPEESGRRVFAANRPTLHFTDDRPKRSIDSPAKTGLGKARGAVYTQEEDTIRAIGFVGLVGTRLQ